MSQIIQHIQPYKENLRKWTLIGCRHWSSPGKKYSCSQQIFPRTSARFSWVVDKSPKMFLHSNHWQLQPRRVSWYHCHCSSFSLRRNPSTARCCSSLQNWSVSSPFCLGSHLHFPLLQLRNGNLVRKRFLVPFIPLVLPPAYNGEVTVILVLHMDVIDCTLKPFSVLYIYLWALIICLWKHFEHTKSSWWSRRFGDCFCSYALPGLFFNRFLFTITVTRCSVFLTTQTNYNNFRECDYWSNRVS